MENANATAVDRCARLIDAAMAKRGDLTEAQIVELLDACSANGAELLEEARLLLDNKHFPRAYVLAQLASEEFAKAHLLLSLLVALVAGINPPMKSFWAWWINHDDKIMFQESWNDAFSRPGVQAWLDLPPDAALEELEPLWIETLAVSLVAAHKRAPSLSTSREDATYVDFRNRRIHVPNKKIGRVTAQRKIVQVAAEAVRANEIASSQLGKLIRIPEAVEFLKRSTQAIAERMGKAPYG